MQRLQVCEIYRTTTMKTLARQINTERSFSISINVLFRVWPGIRKTHFSNGYWIITVDYL